ncbi:MAG: hypothetical protein ACRDRP_03005 [Pseudonocardiaceae bacterium]
MTSDNTTALTPREVLAGCEALSLLTVTVLNEHANDADLCVVCWCAWPCERTVLADHNVAAAL